MQVSFQIEPESAFSSLTSRPKLVEICNEDGSVMTADVFVDTDCVDSIALVISKLKLWRRMGRKIQCLYVLDGSDKDGEFDEEFECCMSVDDAEDFTYIFPEPAHLTLPASTSRLSISITVTDPIEDDANDRKDPQSSIPMFARALELLASVDLPFRPVDPSSANEESAHGIVPTAAGSDSGNEAVDNRYADQSPPADIVVVHPRVAPPCAHRADTAAAGGGVYVSPEAVAGMDPDALLALLTTAPLPTPSHGDAAGWEARALAEAARADTAAVVAHALRAQLAALQSTIARG